jgi:hypothetical protein
VSTIRETQTKDRWRLRAANLNDIDGLHALAASPLVYRYLFDGALPDKEYITRLVTESVANAGETGLGMWFWKMFPRDTPAVSSYDPIHPSDLQNSSTYWTLAIGDRDLP